MAKGGLSSDYIFEERHAGSPDCVDHLDLCHASDVVVTLEVRSFLHFLKGNPLRFINLQTPFNELLQFSTNILLELLIPDVFTDISLELLIILAVQERLLPMQHLINKHPKCPNISLRPIQILHISLRRHIQRRANTKIIERLTT